MTILNCKNFVRLFSVISLFSMGYTAFGDTLQSSPPYTYFLFGNDLFAVNDPNLIAAPSSPYNDDIKVTSGGTTAFFRPPVGKKLVVGSTYYDIDSLWSSSTTLAQMDIDRGTYRDYIHNGQFKILQAERAPDGHFTKLAIDFNSNKLNYYVYAKGSIRINSDIPPTTFLPVLAEIKNEHPLSGQPIGGEIVQMTWSKVDNGHLRFNDRHGGHGRHGYDWNIEINTPDGKPLALGDYSTPSNSAVQAVHVSFDSADFAPIDCQRSSSAFSVKKIGRDAQGKINLLSLTFAAHCEDGSVQSGTVEFNTPNSIPPD